MDFIRPGNLTGPKSYFEIKFSRKVRCVLTSNEVHFVSLANNFTVQFSNLWNYYLEWKTKLPNGPDNYRELRETGPRSNNIPVLNGFVNTIDCDQNQSDLSDLTLGMRRVTGSPWMADFQCWTWSEVIKILVFRPFQFPEQEKTNSGYKHNNKVSHGIFDLTFRMLQHTSSEMTVTNYDEI